MNLVAHQLLSFNNPQIQIGNLLGEVVRGKNFNNYTNGKKIGILLHREIDSFTDKHPTVKKSTQKFHKTHNKYAPVIVDVLYDYILIKNWNKFSNQPYQEFVKNCYHLFQNNFDVFPVKLQKMVSHMIEHDWFNNYSTTYGIQKTLNGISKKSKYSIDLTTAIKEITPLNKELEKEFLNFFPELQNYCRYFIQAY